MSDSEDEVVDVLNEARSMLKNSTLLHAIASHICFENDVEVQCLEKKSQLWETIDRGERHSWDKFDSLKPENFDSKSYRFSMDAGSPFPYMHLFEEEKEPNKVFVTVTMFADHAQVELLFTMSSRDVGYEETPVTSAMNSITTGEWLARHNVPPTVAQFEICLEKCLQVLGFMDWKKHKDEDNDEQSESQTAKSQTVKSQTTSQPAVEMENLAAINVIDRVWKKKIQSLAQTTINTKSSGDLVQHLATATQNVLNDFASELRAECLTEWENTQVRKKQKTGELKVSEQHYLRSFFLSGNELTLLGTWEIDASSPEACSTEDVQYMGNHQFETQFRKILGIALKGKIVNGIVHTLIVHED